MYSPARANGAMATAMETGSPSADMRPPMMARRMAITEISVILNKSPFITRSEILYGTNR